MLRIIRIIGFVFLLSMVLGSKILEAMERKNFHIFQVWLRITKITTFLWILTGQKFAN